MSSCNAGGCTFRPGSLPLAAPLHCPLQVDSGDFKSPATLDRSHDASVCKEHAFRQLSKLLCC
eukprot:scaffold5378_cov280-Ochromonas_danica.AAC.1